jgi:hypothetical protein
VLRLFVIKISIFLSHIITLYHVTLDFYELPLP